MKNIFVLFIMKKCMCVTMYSKQTVRVCVCYDVFQVSQLSRKKTMAVQNGKRNGIGFKKFLIGENYTSNSLTPD